ncbi:caspase family protein [Cohnella soli]|uniref:Caspase domain-containing protein n=1 Tax=Cohnella soli TaxID=425005 RepID=A0ABW0HMQ6_9BACL
MDVIAPNQTYAVIIAVEQYQFPISQVHYAENDARAFYDWLVQDMRVPEEHITMWLNQDATATALREELRYHIKNLHEESRFIFYYAGHGFFAGGSNRVTTWDTHPTNLHDTTVALREVLFDPLHESQCNKSLIFIDACATYLQEQIHSRDLLADMRNQEFAEFVRTTEYQAMFVSCSPGQKSYPSDLLQHGIWTHHLLKALKGEVRDAVYRDQYITDSSLQNYLRQAVPDYIRSSTDHRRSQTPWAQISSSNTFVIRELGVDEQDALTLPLTGLDLAYEDMMFRKCENRSVRSLPGFSRKAHREPEYHSAGARNFINQLMEGPVTEEIDTIYERCKDYLGFRRKQMTKTTNGGGGTLDTPLFRFIIESSQDPDESKQVLIIRTLHLRVDPGELPEDVERIFPVCPDEIVIPINSEVNYDEMVDKFETAEDEIGGKLIEDDTSGYIEYTTPDGTKLIILTNSNELILKPRGARTIREMLTGAKASVLALAQIEKPLELNG